MTIQMVWYGGPKDGEVLLVPEEWDYGPIKVISGDSAKPDRRYVMPRLTKDGVWILPFYEGTKYLKETR